MTANACGSTRIAKYGFVKHVPNNALHTVKKRVRMLTLHWGIYQCSERGCHINNFLRYTARQPTPPNIWMHQASDIDRKDRHRFRTEPAKS